MEIASTFRLTPADAVRLRPGSSAPVRQITRWIAYYPIMADGFVDNPAARLREIFVQINAQPKQISAAEGWANVFGIEPTDTVTLFARLSEVLALAAEVRSLASVLPESARPDVHLANFGQVERSLSRIRSLDQNSVQSFLSDIDTAGWHSLELADILLHRECPERTIPNDTVASLLRSVLDLLEQVIGADDLDDDAKSTLVERLREVQDVLIDCRLRRVGDLERATDGLAGAFVRLWRRVGAVVTLKKVAVVIGLLVSTLDVANRVQELTAGPPSDQETVIVIDQITGSGASLTALPAREYIIHEQDILPANDDQPDPHEREIRRE